MFVIDPLYIDVTQSMAECERNCSNLLSGPMPFQIRFRRWRSEKKIVSMMTRDTRASQVCTYGKRAICHLSGFQSNYNENEKETVQFISINNPSKSLNDFSFFLLLVNRNGASWSISMTVTCAYGSRKSTKRSRFRRWWKKDTKINSNKIQNERSVQQVQPE